MTQRTSRYMQAPDIVEVLIAAKTRVFVSLDDTHHAMISALAQTMCVTIFRRGHSEPARVIYPDCTAQQLGLFDGRGWHLAALASWIAAHCAVCWEPLTSCKATYCSNRCRQQAYRDRYRAMKIVKSQQTIT